MISVTGCHLSLPQIFKFYFQDQYLENFCGSPSFDCYVSFSRSFRILFHSIVTLVSLEFLEFSFIRLLRQYLAQFQDYLSLDCQVSISHTFRIIFQWTVTLVSGGLKDSFYQIVTLVSRALLEFLFNGLLRYYLVLFMIFFQWIVTLVSAHFKDSLSLDCYVLYLTHLNCCVSLLYTFRILSH